MNPEVDAYLKKTKQWRAESERLRTIILGCGLTEELKWGKPCYTFRGSNVVIVQGFKAGCALMFFKGALLKDGKGILEKPGENSQAARRILFTSVDEIVKREPVLKAYIREAVELEKAGVEIQFKTTPEPVPDEFRKVLDGNAKVKTAWDNLTPGRRRAYLMHFSAAKQPKTREARIEKCLPDIFAGKRFGER